MSQKLVIFVILLIIILLLSNRLLAQEQEGEIVIISERVGEVIDLEERNKFNLFRFVEGFQSATLFKLPDSSYVWKITYIDSTTGEQKIRQVSHAEIEIKELGEYIDHFEEIQAGKYQIKIQNAKDKLPKEEKPSLQTPVISRSKTEMSSTEFVAGLGGGVLLGILGGIIAPESQGDDPVEPIIGVISGFVLGSASGVVLTGKKLNDSGSTSGALLGAFICPLVGAILGPALFPDESDQILWGAFFGSFASPLGATIGYAISRPGEQSNSQALLYIKDSKLQIGIPSPMLRAVQLPNDGLSWEYHINLIVPEF